MSIRLVCPGCRKQLELPDAAAGQSGRCPVCNTVFNLPARVQQETYSAAPPPPPRRTAVARPIPTDPVPREDTPATGLTRGQKLGFAVVAAGMLAVIGFFLVLITERFVVHPNWRLFFAVGFLGAYTTFSTFSFETATLIQNGSWWLGLANIFWSVVLGLVAVLTGMALGRLF